MQIVTHLQDHDRNNWMKAEIQTIKIKTAAASRVQTMSCDRN